MARLPAQWRELHEKGRDRQAMFPTEIHRDSQRGRVLDRMDRMYWIRKGGPGILRQNGLDGGGFPREQTRRLFRNITALPDASCGRMALPCKKIFFACFAIFVVALRMAEIWRFWTVFSVFWPFWGSKSSFLSIFGHFRQLGALRTSGFGPPISDFYFLSAKAAKIFSGVTGIS